MTLHVPMDLSGETGFIAGEKVDLVPISAEAYVELNYRWTNDPEVCRFLVRGSLPTSREHHRKNYETVTNSGTELELFIRDKASKQVVGLIGLHNISWIVGSAEFRILIGEPAAWDKGLGTDALRLIMQVGFLRLNLNRIWLGVNAANTRGVRSYEKAGFIREGVLRDEIFCEGQYSDVIRMSVLRREYTAR